MSAYNKSDVFDFPDPHVDLLAVVYREADVEEIVLVGHAADLHEGQEVTVVVTTLVIHGLEGAQPDIVSEVHRGWGERDSLSLMSGTLEMLRLQLSFLCSKEWASSVHSLMVSSL